MRRDIRPIVWLVGALLGAALFASAAAGPAPVRTPATPAAAPDPNDTIAFVNGKPVTRHAVVELLMESHGIEALQQLVVLELAKQETTRAGLTITPDDVEREYRRTLDAVTATDTNNQPVSDDERARMLDTVLQKKGISRLEFAIGVERNANLRKVVEHGLKVDEPTLREEFMRTRGGKAEVRVILIRVADAQRLNDVETKLAGGTDFAEVARQYSQDPGTASRGGEVPPMTLTEAAYPAALRELAFSLNPGQVSKPLRIEDAFYVVKLERRIPPENVRFEDVRADVEAKLRERVIPEQMQNLAKQLFQKAEVRILDQRLQRKFDDLKRPAQ